MIHATLVEHLPAEEDSDERERLNRVLAGTLPDPALVAPATGPLRYAKPGEIARTLKTVPVHEAIAALRAAMPGGSPVGR